MAIPAAKTLVKMEDTAQHRAHRQGDRLPVEVAVRLPRQGRRSFFSTLAARVEPGAPARFRHRPVTPCQHYLLDVDNPLVVPVDTKVRLLLTGSDVIHSWWVPAFGVKKDAIPGFINEAWFKADPQARPVPRPVRRAVRPRPWFHADRGRVRSKEDFAKWLAAQTGGGQAPPPPRSRAATTAMTTPAAGPRRGALTTPSGVHDMATLHTHAPTIITTTSRTACGAGCSRPTTRTSARCTWCSPASCSSSAASMAMLIRARAVPAGHAVLRPAVLQLA